MRRSLLALLLTLALPATAAAANTAPACFDETLPVTAGVGFGAGCGDPDGDPLTIEVLDAPDHGTLRQEGTSFSYTPALGFYGVDELRLRASDGRGGVSAPSLIRFDVHGSPPSCSLIWSEFAMSEDGVDSPGGWCFSERVEVVQAPSHGSFTLEGVAGQWIPVYEPAAGSAGLTDEFSFRAVTRGVPSPEYRVRVAIQPPTASVPAPATIEARLEPAPVISARTAARRRIAVARSGLPLEVGCDVACALRAEVSLRGRVVGTASVASAGRLSVPLERSARKALRRGRRVRLEVLLTATAPNRATSTHAFTTVLR